MPGSYRASYLMEAEYTLLGKQKNLDKFKNVKVLSSIISYHKSKKLQIRIGKIVEISQIQNLKTCSWTNSGLQNKTKREINNYLKETKMEMQGWPLVPTTTGTGPEPGVGHSVRVSHMDGRDTVTWAISAACQSCTDRQLQSATGGRDLIHIPVWRKHLNG